jgi:predicted dehydrogenase
MTKHPDRRSFLQSSASVLGASALGASALASENQTGAKKPEANDRIQIGLIGAGGMGRGNLNNCAAHADVMVTGVCDVWKERRDAVVAKYPTARPYNDYRQMLASDDIDAVIIATPPHWHCLQAVDACAAGKDLYLQKPMTLHLSESLVVQRAVAKHERICQIGTQIHASENYRRVVELVRSGNLGKISVARTFNVMNHGTEGLGNPPDTDPPEGLDWDLWLGPGPMRSFNRLIVNNAYEHCSFMAYSGGWTPGMAPHIIDLPYWALDLGFPIKTSCSGGRFTIRDLGDSPDMQEVQWQYPEMTMIWSMSMVNSFGFDFGRGPRTRRLGVYLHGVNGTLIADYGKHEVVTEGDWMEGMQTPEKSIPPSPGHEREWLDCLRSRKQPSCNPSYHYKIDAAIALANLSMRVGRTIEFDPATETIVGDPEAAKLATPEYRAPWKFPKAYLS